MFHLRAGPLLRVFLGFAGLGPVAFVSQSVWSCRPSSYLCCVQAGLAWALMFSDAVL